MLGLWRFPAVRPGVLFQCHWEENKIFVFLGAEPLLPFMGSAGRGTQQGRLCVLPLLFPSSGYLFQDQESSYSILVQLIYR